MEVVKMTTMQMLAASGDKQMKVDSNKTFGNESSLSSEFFGGGDDGEDW